MAVMPVGGGSRARPCITNVEQAKKTPPTTPLPTTVTMTSSCGNPSSMRGSQVGGPHRGDVDSGKLL